MTFPLDAQLRNQYFAVRRVVADTVDSSDTDKFEIDVRTIRLLIDAPRNERLKEIVSNATKCGIVAGDILSAMYLMDKFSVTEPSLKKAIHLAQVFDKEEPTYSDGTPMKVSDKAIRECWNKFKRVAHLWAALRLNQSYPFSPDHNVFSLTAFTPFLEVAAEILQFGCAFVPKRTRPAEPVLDCAECWTIPSFITASPLISDRVPDRMLKYLESYKAPAHAS